MIQINMLNLLKVFLIKVNDKNKTNIYNISIVCNEYYQKIRNNSVIHPKFIGYIKKVEIIYKKI